MTAATIDFKPESQRVLDRQHGLVTSRQLRGLGVSTRQIQHMVESGQWSTVLHGVYAVTDGPLDRPMTLWAALLSGGPRAILSHRTAAEEWVLTPVDPGPIHVTAPPRTSWPIPSSIWPSRNRRRRKILEHRYAVPVDKYSRARSAQRPPSLPVLVHRARSGPDRGLGGRVAAWDSLAARAVSEFRQR
ncbi:MULTISPECIES: type IV toxin-antitoxin system AbiEi family antitoxin domain-containing protein [unclassified Rhodococcus (in: high G+C Gram-positive bacteria)]|uniref:type IV toxin-antitoxin system AbiEi family antitoxin domain-containing protein n=1 Tax=unclassified Rhodococcus (in: high G+C Gram-positive bacteria) TaxID=192944 RepID=UPI002078CEE6|nr:MULTISPECIES: type IV toxin-antitoxin system AbiEi family antitoxin domain-containing protein [unclassified Rhodococcus (in: high G+C Gram-positive bacteria)]